MHNCYLQLKLVKMEISLAWRSNWLSNQNWLLQAKQAQQTVAFACKLSLSLFQFEMPFFCFLTKKWQKVKPI